MDVFDPFPNEVACRCQTVVREKTGNVGLVNRNSRYVKLSAYSSCIRPETEWCGEMNDVGAKCLQRASETRTRNSELEVSIARYRDTACPHHLESTETIGSIAGGDDHGFVLAGLEVFEKSDNRVCDPVDDRQEAFRDDANSHDATLKSRL